jgi:hypothetical protein
LHRRFSSIGRAVNRQISRLSSFRRRMHGSKGRKLLLCGGSEQVPRPFSPTRIPGHSLIPDDECMGELAATENCSEGMASQISRHARRQIVG